MMKKRVISIYLAVCLLLLPQLGFAYSYAAAGKEPLIEARATIVTALQKNDYASIATALDKVREEITHIQDEVGLILLPQIDKAITEKNSKNVLFQLNRIMASEINRRLKASSDNINNYQAAKVLVIKSKHFLDLLLPELNAIQRKKADDSIRLCLEAIGNPGVFGVGQKPANKKVLDDARNDLGLILSIFNKP